MGKVYKANKVIHHTQLSEPYRTVAHTCFYTLTKQ